MHDDNSTAAGSQDVFDVCGTLEAAGIALSRPCNPQTCPLVPWTVGDWSACSASCEGSPSLASNGTRAGEQTRAVSCGVADEGGECTGPEPESTRECLTLCDACALIDPCGSKGTCMYVLPYDHACYDMSCHAALPQRVPPAADCSESSYRCLVPDSKQERAALWRMDFVGAHTRASAHAAPLSMRTAMLLPRATVPSPSPGRIATINLDAMARFTIRPQAPRAARPLD